MTLSFNWKGKLYTDVELSFEEFQQQFGTNPMRKEKIETALTFFKLFRSCGCKAVYIGGSFVSTKENPEDIDLCFDLRNVDFEKLEIIFPDFFDPNGLGRIRSTLKCQIWHFDDQVTYLLEMLQKDMEDYPKGLVKISLNHFAYD